MFDRSAPYYDAFYAFLDYPVAAGRLHALLRERHPQATTLLDVACGTGRYLAQLAPHYRSSGLDIQQQLLERAARQCPDVRLHHGDMCDFHLDARFDVVTCLFCSVAYARTPERVAAAIRCMAEHLAPGGLLVIEPWIAPQQCWTDRITCEVHDRERDLKIVRMHTHERTERSSVFDIHYMVGTPREVQHFIEREELCLMTRDEYAAAMREAGLEAEYLDIELFPGHRYGLHLGRKPSAPDRDEERNR